MELPLKKNILRSQLRDFPPNTADFPEGWLSHFEAQCLYTATLNLLGGSILEIGSWVGRSTCAIANGIRNNPQPPRFDVVDYGICGFDEWEMRFGDNLLGHPDAKRLIEPICFPGGVGGLLKKNLAERGLGKFVTSIFLGDIKDYLMQMKYDFIFCDATHDEEEIRKNIPIVARLLKENFILICDDIIRDDHLRLVAEMSQADECYSAKEADEYSKIAIYTKGTFNGLFG